jgi:hypothetical protein
MKLDITFSENNMSFKPLFSDANIIDVEEDYYKDIISELEHDKQELNQEIDNLEEEIKQTAIEQYDKGKADGFIEGQESMVDESKLLPRTKTGNPISLKDISELPHKVKCNISHKNLFNNDTSLVKNVTYQSANGNIYNNDGGYELHLPAGVYTLSLVNKSLKGSEFIYTRVNDKNGNYITDCMRDKNGTVKQDAYVITNTIIHTPITYHINDGDVIYIFDAIGQGATIAKPKFERVDFQIEAGTTATEYEPYVDLT